jgi:23S rRNA (uracil1939-C5)-methyltransferase
MISANSKENPKSGNPAKRQMHRKSPLASTAWEGQIERVAWGGLGISRMEDGRILLLEAPLALFPHEIVRATIRQKPKHAEGEVVSWVKPSPSRSAPSCPVAGICGGCDLQGAGAHHSDLKRSMAEDLFRRMMPNQPWEWLAAPLDALRHRIQLHWDGKNIGFHQRKKHRIIPISACPAAVSSISDSIPRLEEAIACRVLPSRPQRWEVATGTPPSEVFAIDETQRAWLLEPDGWHRTEKHVAHNFQGHTLTHRPGGFFQASARWAMEAFHSLLAQWSISGNTLYDLYGGVGLFSVILGDKFKNCVLVESDSDAIVHARQNLANAKLQHQCIEADVAEWMPEGLGDNGDAVLLDPPRAGLAPETIQKLLASKASALILIGCDGAAFCRDVQRLSPAWKLSKLAVIDLFPMTVHVECVGLMERGGGG